MSKRRRMSEGEGKKKEEEEEERRLGRNLWKRKGVGAEWGGGRGSRGWSDRPLSFVAINVTFYWVGNSVPRVAFGGPGGDGWQGEYGGTCKREFKMNGVERNGKEWTF